VGAKQELPFIQLLWPSMGLNSMGKVLLLVLCLLLVIRCKDDSFECIDPARVNDKAACPFVLQPVCGCDGKNYGNACEAEAAGLLHWSSGYCK